MKELVAKLEAAQSNLSQYDEQKGRYLTLRAVNFNTDVAGIARYYSDEYEKKLGGE